MAPKSKKATKTTAPVVMGKKFVPPKTAADRARENLSPLQPLYERVASGELVHVAHCHFDKRKSVAVFDSPIVTVPMEKSAHIEQLLEEGGLDSTKSIVVLGPAAVDEESVVADESVSMAAATDLGGDAVDSYPEEN